MSNETLNQVNKQFDTLFVGPARTYASLALDHFEKLAGAQYEATQAYTEVGLKQVREALSISGAKDFQTYVTKQQKVVQEIGQRLKGDAEKMFGINQEFAQKAQKLAESNMGSVSKAAAQAGK